MLAAMFILVITGVSAFSSELVRRHCDYPVQENFIMMGQSVKFNNTHKISAFKSSNSHKTIIVNNSVIDFDDIENVHVLIEPKLSQVILEINNPFMFENGKCGNESRSNSANAVKIKRLPSFDKNEHGTVKITALWAKSYNEGVKITDPFYLQLNETSKQC